MVGIRSFPFGAFSGGQLLVSGRVYIYIYIGAGRVGQLFIPHSMNDKRSVFVGNKISWEPKGTPPMPPPPGNKALLRDY